MKTNAALIVATLVLMLAATPACESLDAWITDNPTAVDDAASDVQRIGQIAAPATAGWSVPAANVIAALLPALVAINRSILAQRRAKVIRLVDDHPGTPKVLEQLGSSDLGKIVGDALKATA